MLEVRLLHLETKKLYDRVVAEQKVSKRRLLNVLPQSIAERLKGRPEVTFKKRRRFRMTETAFDLGEHEGMVPLIL